MCWCFDLNFYKIYFDVDTADVAERIKSSVMVWKNVNVDESSTNPDCHNPDSTNPAFGEIGRYNVFTAVLSKGAGPDLYGPFWLSMTLVFIVSVTSNINLWFNATEVDFATDVSSIIAAIWVVYSFSVGVPLTCYMALHCLGGKDVSAKMPLVTLISIYGYSLTLFVPCALLCAVPSTAVVYLSLLTATCFSGALIAKNTGEALMGVDSSVGKGVVGWMAGCQIVFFLVLKFYFYS
jgi:hypothetical protein